MFGTTATWLLTIMQLLLVVTPSQADIVVQDAKDYTVANLGTKPFQSFVTRPDLHTPIVNMDWKTQERPSAEDDLTFIMNPHGNNVNPFLGSLLLRPRDGAPLWICHDYDQMFNLQVQNYQGKPHLIFWHGGYDGGFGRGLGYIMNQHYEVVKTVRTANDQVLGDLHEFRLTESGTALIAYQTKTKMVHKGRDVWVRDGCFQEVKIETGELVIDWCSSALVPVSESYISAGPEHSNPRSELDYIHLNSVDKDESTGQYLVSGRHTHTLYLISPQGQILDRIGGKSSNYGFELGADFSWQHDARFVKKKTGWDGLVVSLFDNAWDRIHPARRKRSRGLILGLDTEYKTATPLGSYESPVEQVSGSQGSMQVLDNEEVVVGLGLLPHVALYKPNGEMKLHVQYGFDAESYRSTLKPWTGIPKTNPVMNIGEHDGPNEEALLYVSWNGATEVSTWRLVFSATPSASRPKQWSLCDKKGFETTCELSSNLPWVQAQALAANGTVLGASEWSHRDVPPIANFENEQALEEGFTDPRKPSSVDHGKQNVVAVGIDALTRWFKAANGLSGSFLNNKRH